MVTSAIGTTAMAVRKNVTSNHMVNPEMVVCSTSIERGHFASVAARRKRLLWCRHQKKK